MRISVTNRSGHSGSSVVTEGQQCTSSDYTFCAHSTTGAERLHLSCHLLSCHLTVTVGVIWAEVQASHTQRRDEQRLAAHCRCERREHAVGRHGPPWSPAR